MGAVKRPRRDGERLLRRLALTPIAAEDRKGPPIALVYVVFGAVTVALMATALVLHDWDRSKWAISAVIGLTLVWCIVAFAWALPRAFGDANRTLAPLGLRLLAKPSYVPNLASGGGQLDGAIVYGGERHGRHVRISHKPSEASTVVSANGAGWGAALIPPSSAAEMTMLTGEPEGAWRHVTVEVGPDHVAVFRRRNGAGGWMLHDLLLADALAARR